MAIKRVNELRRKLLKFSLCSSKEIVKIIKYQIEVTELSKMTTFKKRYTNFKKKKEKDTLEPFNGTLDDAEESISGTHPIIEAN